ncbi:hypothetical protein Tco_0077919 [Tanacetum coccineum]
MPCNENEKRKEKPDHVKLEENVDILIKPSTEDIVFINVAVALTIMEKCFVPMVDTRTCDGVKNITSLGSEHRFVSHGSDLNSGRSNKMRLHGP